MQIRSYDATVAMMDDKIQAERAVVERRLAVLEESLKSKETIRSQYHDELSRLRQDKDALSLQVEKLLQENARLQESEQQTSKSLILLEENTERLQSQLQHAQKQNDQLTLELKSQQASLTDRVQLYEEKKKELQHFYERKDSEEEKRCVICKGCDEGRRQVSLTDSACCIVCVADKQQECRDRALANHAQQRARGAGGSQ